jgi:hypothetical protein
VKALSFELSEKHLRQTINYGANEGIEYALLTNGRHFEFYKILFEKPIDARKLFELDLSDITGLKNATDFLQHLHRDSTVKNSFKPLWNKCEATDPLNISGILCSDGVINQVKKLIKGKYDEKCDEDDILKAIHKIITEKIDLSTVRPFKISKSREKKAKPAVAISSSLSELSENVSEQS